MNATWILRILVLGGLALLVLSLVQSDAWRHFSGSTAPETPVRNSAPDPTLHRILAEGRVETYPGARVVLSSEIAGVLTNILVREQSRLDAGGLIAEIQADDIHAALLEARAQVVEIESEIGLAQLEFQRGQTLSETGVLTRQELDRLERGLQTLQARRTTAQVRVRRLEITLAKARISAPFAGIILARHAHAGEVVAVGTPLVTLANLDRVRVEAEVDEFDAGRIRLGAQVRIRAEGFPESWKGEVEEIPDIVEPRILHPQDPAQPSDVRVLRVKIALMESSPLKLGQRVELEIACPADAI